MRRFIAFGLLGLLALHCGPKVAQTDFLNESSEAKNERMAWWREARFGMFIHWGLYAVPAGQYQGKEVWGTGEWIMNSAPIPILEYEQYAGRFNPIKFDADVWAKLAHDAGMKYLVITSKHHDGFCLWDSKVSDYDIMDRTPFKRDVLKELSAACAKYGVRFAVYHSIMDWHHPEAQGIFYPNYNTGEKNPKFDHYVESYLKPQLVELVNGYHPAVLWFDGQWIPDWTLEKGKGLYQYVRGLEPSILVNNRVGKGGIGLSGKLEEAVGDFGTPEQEIPAEGLPGVDWESCMTLNDTWGYRTSDHNWKSDTTLITNLIRAASGGGNFLLNVGPDAEGVIPEAGVERLHEMGEWLKVNGEAIYNTRMYRTSREGENVRYTMSGDGKTVYAIHIGLPGPELKLGSIVVPDGSSISLLGVEKLLNWHQAGDTVVIDIPVALSEHPRCRIAYVFKMQTKPFVEKPVITSSKSDRISVNEPITVNLNSTTPGSEIRYTLDDADPEPSSTLCQSPVVVNRSCVLKAKAFKSGYVSSVVSEAVYSIIDSTKNGMRYELFSGSWASLPDFEKLKPVKTGAAWFFDPARIRLKDDAYGIVFRGDMAVPSDGEYMFYLKSDDGSRLFIHDKLFVSNDGLHGPVEASGKVSLKAGIHSFRLEYFEATGGETLELAVDGPGMSKQPVPPHWLIKPADGR